MVQISKHKLSEEMLAKLFQVFFKTLEKKNETEFNEIIDDIFSPVEKIMIVKRVAICYLLQKSIDQARICTTLKVSSSTVAKYALITRNEVGIVQHLKKMIKNEKFIELLEDIFYEVFYSPPKPGINWSNALRVKRQKQIRRSRGI